MSTYTPPLKEIHFALRTWAKLPELLATSSSETSVDESTVVAILDGAGRFASEVLEPLEIVGHTEGCEVLPDGRVRMPNGWKEAYAQFVAARACPRPYPLQWLRCLKELMSPSHWA